MGTLLGGSIFRPAAWLSAFAATLAILLIIDNPAWADTISQVSSQSAQAPTDAVIWSRLGSDGSKLGQSFNTTSSNGTTVSVNLSGSNSQLSVVCPASTCSWAGAGMPTSDTLIWTSNGNNGGNGPITLNFNRGQGGVGALIQSDGPSQFTAMLQVFNGSTSLGSFTSTSDSKGTALYLGVIDKSGANITSAVFSLTSAQGVTTDFAIDSLSLGTSVVTSPPPPPPPPTQTIVATATATLTRTATATPVPQVATPTSTPVQSSSGAITYIGSGALTDSATAVTSLAVALPAGVVAGDTLLTQIVVYDGSASDVPTAPAGWTAIRHDSATGGNKLTSWLYYRVAGSGEPRSYTWSLGSNFAAAVMGAWRGAAASPIDKSSGIAASGNSVVLGAPSLVPSNNKELEVFFYGAQAGNSPLIGLANMLTEHFEDRSVKEGFAIASADIAAPGAGSASPTYSASTSSAAMSAQAVLLIASSQGSPPGAPLPPPPATATPTPVASANITFVATGQLTDFAGPTTSVSLGVPSGIRAGDTLIAQLAVYDDNGSDVPTAPGGWTAIRDDSVSNGNQLTSWLFYKVAGSSEPSTYTWSLGSTWAAGVIGAWRGASSSSPIDQKSGATAAGEGLVSISAPSLTSSSRGEVSVYFYASQSSEAPTISASGALNQRFDVKSSKEGFSLAIADVSVPSAGVTSPSYPSTITVVSGGAVATAQVILLH